MSTDDRIAPPTSVVGSSLGQPGAPATSIVSALQTTVVSEAPVLLAWIPQEVFERFPNRENRVDEGTEAVVLSAVDPENGRVAVKVYRRALSPDVDLLAKLQNAEEAHVVGLIDAMTIGGCWVEVLERIDGGSLEDLVRSGRPSNDLLTMILVELTDAIEYFHSMDLVHRDLKPANVLVRKREPLDLVLADFGLAAFASDEIDLRAQDRTIHYSSPETNSGVPPRPPADWWSLGVIMVELLIGRHPFDGRTDVEIANHLAARDVDLAEVSDPRWHLLTTGLLTRDAAHRWGATQVREWIAGGAPSVWKAAITRPPYEFCGGKYNTGRELAAAMGERWTESVVHVGGEYTWRQLTSSLLAESPGDGALAALLDEVVAIDDGDARLFRLLRGAHPDLPAMYRGFALEGDGLSLLAAAAVGAPSDSDEIAAVDSLFDSQALRWLDAGGPAMDTQWHEDWESTRTLVLEHRTLTDLEVAVARARLLSSLLDPASANELHDRSNVASGGTAGRVAWFRSLASSGRSSTTCALAAVMLEETALAELRTQETEARAARDERRRAEHAETSRRYPRTRTYLGWTLVPIVLMAIASIASRFVRVPATTWYSAPSVDGKSLVSDAVMGADFIEQYTVGLPWLEGYVSFLLRPAVPVLLALIGSVLYVRARGVEPTGGPVRSEWERRGIQAVIAASCLYLPLLIPFVAVNIFRGMKATAVGYRPNRTRRILLLVASFGLVLHGAAVFIRLNPQLSEWLWQFPNWYSKLLAEVPPQVTAAVNDGRASWGWLSLLGALGCFGLAVRSFQERSRAEVVASLLFTAVGFAALVPGVLLVGFYPLYASAVVLATVVGVVMGIILIGVLLSGS